MAPRNLVSRVFLRPLCAAAVIAAWFLFPNAEAHAQLEQPQAARRWTSEWSFDDIDLEDLTKKFRLVGIELPIELSGRASVRFDVAIPVTALRSSKEYRFHGTLQVKDLLADDAKFESFEAEVDFRDGLLRFERLHATQGSGTIRGTATAKLDPSDDFEAALNLQQVDVGPIAKVLTKFGVGTKSKPVRGFADATINARGQVSDLSHPEEWNITGSLRATQLAIGESNRYDVTIQDFQLNDGKVRIPMFQVGATKLPDFFARGKAQFRFDGTDTFEVGLAANDLPLTDLLGMYFESPKSLVDGKLDLQATVRGRFAQPDSFPQFSARALMASPETNNSPELARCSAEAAIGHRDTRLRIAKQRQPVELGTVHERQLQLRL